jgi:catechol 2,3-dioxygenase-like lactoylglutathione lyase family enzyme
MRRDNVASTGLTHLQVNVNAANMQWYKDVLDTFGGWTLIGDYGDVVGLSDGHASVWFAAGANEGANDRDGVGVGHIAVGAESVDDVDRVASALGANGVEFLWGTPQHRPDFASDGTTYYQIMFLSPDGVQFEYVYQGPYQA